VPGGFDPDRFRITQLYYITHSRNIPSILERGILSHEIVEREGVPHETVYAPGIVRIRGERQTPDGRTLLSYANLYFQPRNPMLFRVLFQGAPLVEDIAILGVDKSVVNLPGVFIAAGNAVYTLSEMYAAGKLKEALSEFENDLALEYWSDKDGSKRRIMAECLVQDRVPPEYVKSIFVANPSAGEKVRALLGDHLGPGVDIVPEPHMFFQPARRSEVTSNLSVIDGDMFFSRMQTLTISVNCVGVMGKGLASRAKYQFPDVYVRYQDLCRNKSLRLGKPYLYKREGFEVADQPDSLVGVNGGTWFLLFPTKDHWREQASVPGIRDGLEWFVKRYKEEGIASLAMPALGCGQGGLEWRDMGPLICGYLSTLEIPVQLYLPAEKRIPDVQLAPEFLVGKRRGFFE